MAEHVEHDQPLPVVRVGEIPREENGPRWLVEQLWGASSRSPRMASQQLQLPQPVVLQQDDVIGCDVELVTMAADIDN